jgi:hypothetical protein
VTVPDVLAPFIGALNLEKLRVGPPRRFIFFCGGQILLTHRRPRSLRDYLKRRIDKGHSLNVEFVYAETATALFRDLKYKDLIQFEADIAQISEVVLLIAESPGSLTELGAFSMYDQIAPRLHVFVQGKYYNAESFIVNGPLRHLNETYPDSVFYYPWRVHKDNSLIVTSISSEVAKIMSDIFERLRKSKKTEEFDILNARHIMISIFRCIFILRGASLTEVTKCIKLFGIAINSNDVHKYLYCMRVAEWISEQQYSNTVY